ncbi:MAG: hypothetical protein A2Z20_06705 [Bdellovibrionales bacterium RBG_16_40_8]|nr:MAG: hypothetical protein A2Z20_06705 [Bdellovibrionales bacterium RBG_16_40_8]
MFVIEKMKTALSTGALVIVSFLYVLVNFCNAQEPDPAANTPESGMVPDNFVWMGVRQPSHVLIADKEKRTLTVWSHIQDMAVFVGAFPMDIGKNNGDKFIAGDARTPEGIYFFQDKLEGDQINFDEYGRRAFTLDYPNFFDSLAGKTGHGIWLHAVPETVSLKRGSRGCVVVRNEIIDKLTPMISLKNTPLLILNKVNYVKPEKLQESSKSVISWLEGWRSSWESKNIESYMAYYNNKFKAMKMGKDKWRNYKSGLNQKYSYIKVGVRDPLIISRNNELVLRFIQEYESDGLKDTGEKTLYVKKDSSNQYEIITEYWRSLNHDLLAKKQIGE